MKTYCLQFLHFHGFKHLMFRALPHNFDYTLEGLSIG